MVYHSYGLNVSEIAREILFRNNGMLKRIGIL